LRDEPGDLAQATKRYENTALVNRRISLEIFQQQRENGVARASGVKWDICGNFE